MKKIVGLLATGILFVMPLFSQVRFDSMVTVRPVVTPTATGMFAPAIYAFPDYTRSGPATVLLRLSTVNGTPGTYNNITPTAQNTSGTGLIVSITVEATFGASVTVTNGGSGYKIGDILTIPRSAVGSPTAGTYQLIIGNITQVNNVSVNTAPIVAESYIRGGGFTGAFTPLFGGRALNRDGLVNGPRFEFGPYNTDVSNRYMSFLIDGVYTLGMLPGQVYITNLSTGNITATTGSFSNLSSAQYASSGSVGSANIFQDAVARYQPSGSFRNIGLIPPGSVGSVTITNAGSGYTPGNYTVLTTGGSGTGLVLDITVNGAGIVTSAARSSGQTNFGSGYMSSDIISAVIPGGSNFAATVNMRAGGDFPVFASNRQFRGNAGDRHISFYSNDVINQPAGSTGDVYGFYYNPVLTSLRGKNIAFQNVTGDVYLSTTSGNVGIGTTNPGSYKLAVAGIIGAHRIKVVLPGSGWADYVFDSSYQLASLQQVEKYIQVNKHLPDVPSTATVKKDGLDLGDNQIVLLRKIEELTLYIIEQNKQLEEQRKVSDSQKQQLEVQKQANEAQMLSNAALATRLEAIEKMLAALKR